MMNKIEEFNVDEYIDKVTETKRIFRQSLEKYGKEQYPFGFKLHYMKDLQGYQMVGENNDTWRIQCGVTITNAYGASYDATCQAEITGSNEAPEVTDFVVF